MAYWWLKKKITGNTYKIDQQMIKSGTFKIKNMTVLWEWDHDVLLGSYAVWSPSLVTIRYPALDTAAAAEPEAIQEPIALDGRTQPCTHAFVSMIIHMLMCMQAHTVQTEMCPSLVASPGLCLLLKMSMFPQSLPPPSLYLADGAQPDISMHLKLNWRDFFFLFSQATQMQFKYTEGGTPPQWDDEVEIDKLSGGLHTVFWVTGRVSSDLIFGS